MWGRLSCTRSLGLPTLPSAGRRAVIIARDINWEDEIDDETRAWLEQRLDAPAGEGKSIGERLRDNDEKYGRAAKQAKMTRAERIAELRTVIADAQIEIDRLETEQANEENQNFAMGGDPANGTAIFDNTGVDGKAPEGAPADKQTYADPKYWTVGRLQEEIESRNPDRVQAGLLPISAQGKRAELVERLLKDDEEIEAEEG